MDLVGPLVGSIVAAAISAVSLLNRFRRHPFGDRRARALLLWLSVMGVDIGAFAFFAAGYSVIEGVAPLDPSSVVGWLLAGAAVPLALRSPIRETEVAGTQRAVGITYIYDWVRAQLEVRLDGRLTELRRSDERAAVDRLVAKGLGFEQFKAELIDHFDQAQRLSAEARIGIAAAIEKASTLDPPSNLRGLVRIARENQAGALIERLTD
jgi:hypothetical protein